MAIIFNRERNLSIEITPILMDEFGFLCKLCVNSELIKNENNDSPLRSSYVSHENLKYFIKNIENLNNIETFKEETDVVFDFYPIDMFIMMDVFKSTNDFLWIESKIPAQMLNNMNIDGYFVGFNFWVHIQDFLNFTAYFVAECNNFISLKNKDNN